MDRATGSASPIAETKRDESARKRVASAYETRKTAITIVVVVVILMTVIVIVATTVAAVLLLAFERPCKPAHGPAHLPGPSPE